MRISPLLKSMRTFFLAWQDQEKSRLWFPVGRLDAERFPACYQFRYIRGAQEANKLTGFSPLEDFPNFESVYRSEKLFPAFQNRVLNQNRVDFAQYMQWMDLDPKNNDPLDILAISGGYRVTDHFEVFPKIVREPNGDFQCRFFVHGWRHVNPASQERLRSLRPGESLSLALELTNPVTGFAIQLQTRDYFTVGWAPRYLVNDLVKVMAEAPHKYEIDLVRVNPAPAPYKQRFLVELRGKWPEGYKPMSSPEFEVLAAAESES